MPQEDPSRTEKATPKQQKRAREKGNVAKGQELSKTVVLIVAVATLYGFIDLYHEHLTYIFSSLFRRSGEIVLDKIGLSSLFYWAMKEVALLTIPFFLVMAITSFIATRLQVGSLWTTQPMRPKFGKLFNVIGGIKKILISPQAVVQFLKTILSAIAIGIAPYLVIKEEMPKLLPLFHYPPDALAAYLLKLALKMVTYALIPMILIAVAEYAYTVWDYKEQLKMTKDEVKDERKQAEGNPEVKQEQRKKMMSVMASRMMEQVPKADVVITNPVHLAVALMYNPLEAPAPLLLAKGAGATAEKIKEIAREHDIPILEDKPLAQALYKQVEIGDIIPEELYQAVAAILAKLSRFKRRYK